MSKVFVAGHRGLVGSATLKALGSQADVVPIVHRLKDKISDICLMP